MDTCLLYLYSSGVWSKRNMGSISVWAFLRYCPKIKVKRGPRKMGQWVKVLICHMSPRKCSFITLHSYHEMGSRDGRISWKSPGQIAWSRRHSCRNERQDGIREQTPEKSFDLHSCHACKHKYFYTFKKKKKGLGYMSVVEHWSNMCNTQNSTTKWMND